MPQSLSSTMRTLVRLNGRHIGKSATTHAAELKLWGVTEQQIKGLLKLTDECEAMEADAIDEGPTFEDLKNDLLDRLKRLKHSAILVVQEYDDTDKAAARDLKIGGTFPATELQIKRHLNGLAAGLKRQAAKLLKHNFSKELMAQLLASMAAFTKASKTQQTRKATRRATTTERDAAYKKLNHRIRHVREAGVSAFYDRPERADFDTIRQLPKAAKTQRKSGGAGPSTPAQGGPAAVLQSA